MTKKLDKTALGNTSKTSTSNKKTSSPKKITVINIDTPIDEVRAALRKKSNEEFNAMQTSFPSNEEPIPPNNGRFEPGVSGNPAGRPLGSRNKATILGEQMIEDAGPDIARVVLHKALVEGNMSAARLCLNRALPIKKGGYVQLAIKATDNPNELPFTLPDVLREVAEGRMTPADAANLASVMTAHAKNVEATELLKRLDKLESHLALVQSFEEKSKHVATKVLA